jgi:hypothetical protein
MFQLAPRSTNFWDILYSPPSVEIMARLIGLGDRT